MTMTIETMRNAIENLPAESLLEVVNAYREEVTCEEPIHYADYYVDCNINSRPMPTFEEACHIATEYLDENLTPLSMHDWVEVLMFVGYEPADLF